MNGAQSNRLTLPASVRGRRVGFSAVMFAAAWLVAGAGSRAGAVEQPVAAAVSPAVEAQMRTAIADAWHDATTTWNDLLGARAYDSDIPQINFVKVVRPSHCYGLYVGSGPVYCSGNNTVFVSLEEMQRLSLRLGPTAGAGLAFLVAHELGHHVQKILGRFRVLQALVRENPRLQRELSVRFELEADCLAGVWAGNSPVFARSETERSNIISTLGAIGDDQMRASEGPMLDPTTFTHGTSEQRLKWYRAGFESRSMSTCSVLEAATY